MRRVLVVPSVGHASVADDDAYEEFYALSKVASEAGGERSFWYFVVPSWARDGLQGHSNLRYIHLDSTRDPAVNNVSGFPALELAKYFGRRGGRYVVDAVLTDCLFFGVYLRKLLSDPSGREMPVFLRDRGGQGAGDSQEDRLSLAASYASCYTVYRSEENKRVMGRFVSRYLNPAMTRCFSERCVEWKSGYNISELEKIGKYRKKRDDLSMFLGGFFEPEMRAKKSLLELARRLSIAGVAEVRLATPSSAFNVSKFVAAGDDSFIGDMHTKIRGQVYQREVARGDFFVSVANDLACYLEFEEEIGRILLGQVGIFPGEKWIMSRLGGDYPFLYNPGCFDEAYALALWIAQNRDNAVRMMGPVKERFASEHRLDNVCRDFFGLVGAIIDEHYMVHKLKKTAKKNSLFKLIHDIADKLGDEFVLDVFLDVLEEHATWLKPWGRKGTLKSYGDVGHALPTLYDIREMLDNLGWVDLCDGADIRLKKIRSPLSGVIDG